MAKEKKSINLTEYNISFFVQKSTFKVLRFHPAKMTVDVAVYENETKTETKTLPFAHLPKEIKKRIKPN
ncbi:hypothetical protein [Sulfurimonas sp.]|uniref:hypothetical protein n=1 Tax=Sulfurimonas sp. TaxID=2022749 RepID=UPI00262BF489|nr:hypothetical protein [Sulfurimonas sp.]MDD3452013.1 hypothetical protein [Sulfurimonas sp.]